MQSSPAIVLGGLEFENKTKSFSTFVLPGCELGFPSDQLPFSLYMPLNVVLVGRFQESLNKVSDILLDGLDH